MKRGEHFTIREQFEELECVYLERRNQLRDLERQGKIPPDQVPHRHRRLMRLRQARETLYRMALRTDGPAMTEPQDFDPQHKEDAA